MRLLGCLCVVCLGLLAWVLYVDRPDSQHMTQYPVFAVELVSSDVNVDELAQRVDCVNEGPVGQLPLVYRFRYVGRQPDPLEWIQRRSDAIQWIEPQVPRMRYKRVPDL
jgi:hypothetical protein